MKKILFSVLAAGLLGSGLQSQEPDKKATTLRLTAELRPRTEYSHGYGTLATVGQKPSLFTSQRTRIGFEMAGSGFQSKVVLQDVRIWGNQPQQVSNEDFATSVHEAWGEVSLVKGLSVRLGRQELSYDNMRILGPVGWAQQGRSHDLVLLKFKGYVDAHFGMAYHESGNRKNNLYLGPDAYKFMQFLWINKSFGDLKISALALNNGIPRNETNDKGEVISQKIIYTQTVGPWFSYTKGNLLITGNAYYQTGELVNRKQLSAYEYLIEAAWKPVKEWTFTGGFEELSGTRHDESPLNARSFNPMYPTGHIYNGHMDYFYIGNHIGSVGLRDLYVKTGYTLRGVNFGLDIHKFWSQADLPNDAEKNFGTELDFYTGYKINETVQVQAGYSHLFASPSLELIKGGDAEATQNWAWLMITFKPSMTW